MSKAVVVGLCAHGLAIVRGLQTEGVDVIALESNSSLPGCRTAKAKVVIVPDVNSEDLVAALVSLSAREFANCQPVLFVTNDRMVRIVGEHWSELKERYTLSWGESVEQVCRYLDKQNIESRCEAVGIHYPVSRVLEDCDMSLEGVRYPAIVKPANPLGQFKAVVIQSEIELREITSKYRESAPFLVQDWVPGGDRALFVCVLLLGPDGVAGRFDGRKLSSFPHLVGQTSVMESTANNDVYEQAIRFFSGTGIFGPAAIELKRGPDGTYFMIEPTVGRTDYFVDAMIGNGVNLPFLEFALASKTKVSKPCLNNSAVWFDTERDRTSFIRLAFQLFAGGRLRRPIFSYFRLDDLGPWFRSLQVWLQKLGPRIKRKIRRRI